VQVTQAYRFALDPSPAQERALRSHAGAARFGWNWGLGKCRERYAAERKWYSGAELHRLWNAELELGTSMRRAKLKLRVTPPGTHRPEYSHAQRRPVIGGHSRHLPAGAGALLRS